MDLAGDTSSSKEIGKGQKNEAEVEVGGGEGEATPEQQQAIPTSLEDFIMIYRGVIDGSHLRCLQAGPGEVRRVLEGWVSNPCGVLPASLIQGQENAHLIAQIDSKWLKKVFCQLWLIEYNPKEDNYAYFAKLYVRTPPELTSSVHEEKTTQTDKDDPPTEAHGDERLISDKNSDVYRAAFTGFVNSVMKNWGVYDCSGKEIYNEDTDCHSRRSPVPDTLAHVVYLAVRRWHLADPHVVSDDIEDDTHLHYINAVFGRIFDKAAKMGSDLQRSMTDLSLSSISTSSVIQNQEAPDWQESAPPAFPEKRGRLAKIKKLMASLFRKKEKAEKSLKVKVTGLNPDTTGNGEAAEITATDAVPRKKSPGRFLSRLMGCVPLRKRGD